MPIYGSDAAVKRLLGVMGATFDADAEARIAEVRGLASAIIEEDIGATFQTPAPAATVRDVQADDGTLSSDGQKLYLPLGVRSVTAITEGPDWVSGAWTGGTALTTSQYRLTNQVPNGAYRTITHMDGSWAGTYLITAVWEDTYTSIPDDVTYIANFVAAEVYKAQKASPHGLIGPNADELVPIRKAMNVDEVKRVIEYYRVGPGMWCV